MNENNMFFDMNKINTSIALWLSNNSYLTDQQISEFCNITELEFKKIISENDEIFAVDPIKIGMLTQDDIDKCEKNESMKLQKADNELYKIHSVKAKKELHNQKLSAILWILNKNLNSSSKKIANLLGVDSHLVDSIKKRTPLKIVGVPSKSPFSMGICTKVEQQTVVI